VLRLPAWRCPARREGKSFTGPRALRGELGRTARCAGHSGPFWAVSPLYYRFCLVSIKREDGRRRR
ncbi:hypothetical protein NHX12_028205, partial [Muraenolepis orangiensis]